MLYANLNKILAEIPDSVTLVAVSKTKPVEDILEVYAAGQRIFGENKVQEMAVKSQQLPIDIQWHMIGHLQRNKVKYIASFVSLIHSVDSNSLLQTINKEAEKNNRIIDCLLQMYIASEETKFGLDISEVMDICTTYIKNEFPNVRIRGLMGMASFTEDNELIHKEFKSLKQAFDKTKKEFFADKEFFNVLSMGMSNDYHIAIEEGSNMIRIGSSIFGERNYSPKSSSCNNTDII